MEQYKSFINGGFVDATSGQTLEVIDPGKEQPIPEVARGRPGRSGSGRLCSRKHAST